MKALVSAIKREPGLTKQRLLDAVAAYIAGKPPDIEFCHLATWLNGSRWDDEWPHPAAGRDGRAGRLRGGDAVLAGMGRLAGRFADRMTPYETMVAGFAADLAERPDSQFGMRIGAEAARGGMNVRTSRLAGCMVIMGYLAQIIFARRGGTSA